MTTKTVVNATDTYVSSASPSKRFSRVSYLKVSATSFGYLYFSLPFTRGATIVSAKLTLTSYSAAAATRTYRVGRVASKQNYSTMSWDNKPAMAPPYATATSSTANGGQKWVFDVATQLQAVSDGAFWWGFRVDTTSTAPLRFDSSQSPYADRRPMLVVEWADEPDIPSDLAPDGGLAVSTPKPVLRYTYGDFGGNTELSAQRIQVSTSPTFSSIFWDSGVQPTTIPEFDLATSTFPGFTAAVMYWRVMVQDGSGKWSTDYSDGARVRYVERGLVTITQPSGDTIMDPTPPVSWTFTGAQSAYRIIVYRGDKIRFPVYDSGRRPSASQATFVPEGILRDDKTYTVTVQVWDDVERASVPGAPAYRQQSKTVWFDDDLATPRPTAVTATQRGQSPLIDVEWTVANQPDAFQLSRDGVILGQFEPSEVRVVGQRYIFTDRTAPPLVPVRYDVRCVVAGKRSVGMSTMLHHKVPGVWLTTPTETVCLAGQEVGSPTLGERSTVHEVGERVVVITDALRGHEGDWSGELYSDILIAQGVTAKEWRDRLMRIRSNPLGARLHMGPVNVPVTLANINVRANPHTELSYTASFSYWQVAGPELDDLDEIG